MMYSQATKTPEDKLTAEAKAIKETYGQAVDYVNFDTLNPVVEKCTIGAWPQVLQFGIRQNGVLTHPSPCWGLIATKQKNPADAGFFFVSMLPLV